MKPETDYSQKLDKLRNSCPVKATIDVIRGRWKPSLLRQLRDGIKRFTELRAALPEITAQTLTVQLRQLEADGVIVRTIYQEMPARVEYELSEYGRALSKVMEELESWGEDYLRRQQQNGASKH
jgi:DNA-binding HxlR family transcriptional regulator